MKSIEAFKILANVKRTSISEDSRWVPGRNVPETPPMVERCFRHVVPNQQEPGKVLGYSHRILNREEFFVPDAEYEVGRKVGYTLEDSEGLRTFYDVDKNCIGHEEPSGKYTTQAKVCA